MVCVTGFSSPDLRRNLFTLLVGDIFGVILNDFGLKVINYNIGKRLKLLVWDWIVSVSSAFLLNLRAVYDLCVFHAVDLNVFVIESDQWFYANAAVPFPEISLLWEIRLDAVCFDF